MTKQTRRGFLVQASLGSTAILATLSGCANGSAQASPDTDNVDLSKATVSETEPLVAYINNLQTGEIVLLAGAREIVFRDADLAKRLWKASR